MFCARRYYVYFAVLRNGMAIYNCKIGKSGRMTMATEPSVMCDMSDPVYATLQPYSVLSICIYGIGIPLMFVSVLVMYRHEIRADQKLRAMGMGDAAEENPQLFVRKRYQKLYNDFQPEFFYWRLVLIARKFLLVQCSTFLSRDAMLQASISATIMFFCYVIQAAHRPFLRRMPTSAAKLQGVIGEVGAEKAKKLSYVFDYNTLENALLITSTMTLMAGMVFSSASLDMDNNSPGFVALAAVIVIMLGIAITGFVLMLAREIFRSFQFALISAAIEDKRARTIKITVNTRYTGSALNFKPSEFVPKEQERTLAAAAKDAGAGLSRMASARVRTTAGAALERGRKSIVSLVGRVTTHGGGEPARAPPADAAPANAWTGGAPLTSNPIFKPRPPVVTPAKK